MNPITECIGRLTASWRRLAPAARWRLALALPTAGLVLWMLVSPKPWTIDLPTADFPRTADIVKVYAWYAALLNTGVLLALMALCPWWAEARVSSGTPIRRTPGREVSSRIFIPVVAAAVIVCAAFSLPRLGHSLWDDEAYTVRRCVVGFYKVEDGEARLRPVRWEETLYFYRMPNNHVLNSILARACHGLWLAAHDPAGGQPFNEAVLRLPAWLAGMGAVAAIAWMLRDFGFPRAAMLAAWLLALHPRHQRYVSECRGYTLVLLLLPLALVCWRRAVTCGHWKWWGWGAACQFLLLYAYPGMLYTLVVLNLGVLLVVGISSAAAGPRATQLGRWFLASSVAGMAALQLMLPLLPQAARYIREEPVRLLLGWPWLQNVFSYLLAGVPWTKTRSSEASHYAELLPRVVEHPLLFQTAAVAAILLFAAGCAVWLRRGLVTGVAWCVLVAPPALAFFAARMKGIYIFEWYLLYALVGVVACAAVGAELLWRGLDRLRMGPVPGCLTVVALVFAFAVWTHPHRQWLIENPLQQTRESVRLCRPHPDPLAPEQREILTASFCGEPDAYDARVVLLRTRAELEALMAEARATGRPLYLNISNAWSARTHTPELWQIFTDESLFEPLAELPGFDPTLTRRVARYRGSGAAR